MLLLDHSYQVMSQTNSSPELNKVIQDVLKAEAAGAQPKELTRLINQLNSEIDLENQLQSLSPQEGDKRSQLQGRITNILATVDAEADQLKTTASHRTLNDHLVTYSLALVGAILVTIAFYVALSLRRKYRIRSTLRSRIVPK